MAPLVFDAHTNHKARRFHLTFGRSRSDIRWIDRRDYSFQELASTLSHATVGGKDGACYTPAVFSGTMRRKEQACQIDIAALDSDCGHSLADIRDSIARLGWRAIIHSTHSHMSDQTIIAAAAAERWMQAEPGRDITGYMLFRRGYLPHILEGAEIIDEVSEGAERNLIVKHKPCPKFRVLLPLDTPWLADEYESQNVANAKWRERIGALAAMIGLHHDQSCVDTSRLFYLPRLRKEGQEFLHVALEGEDCPIWGLPDAPTDSAIASPESLFAWQSPKPIDRKNVVAIDAGRNAAGNIGALASKDHKIFTSGVTGEVFDLTSWAKGFALRFEIVDALRARSPGIFSDRRNGVKHHIFCPNSGSHFTGGAEGTGSYAVNASQMNVSGLTNIASGFALHCMHNGCNTFDRLDHLRAMLDSGALAVEDLTAPQFLAPDRSPQGGFVGGRLPRVAQEAGGASAGQGSSPAVQGGPQGGVVVALSRATRELRGAEDAAGIEGNIPARLYENLPGILGKMQHWMMTSAQKPQPVLSLGASLAFAATVIGQKVKLQKSGIRPNIYVLGVARSGAGKDRPQKACKELAQKAGLRDELIGVEEIASDSGIFTAVADNPSQLILIDEASSLLSMTGDAKSSPHIKNVITTLLKLYSSSNSYIKAKSYADKDKNKTIDQPCVSFYGSCVPTELENALTQRDINSGLLSRMMIFDAGDNDPRMSFDVSDDKSPEVYEIVDWITAWNRISAKKNPLKRSGGVQVLEQIVVVITEEAEKIGKEFEGEMHEEKKKAIARGKDALYVRAYENALKFALIRACCVPSVASDAGPFIDEQSMKVDAETMRWAVDLSRCTVERMDKITDEIADTQYQQQIKYLKRIIKRSGEKGSTKRDILKSPAGQHPDRVINDLVAYLENSGSIKEIVMKTKGRDRKAYVEKSYWAVHNLESDREDEADES